MLRGRVAALLALLATTTTALIYRPEEVGYNLNENKTATEPAEYWGEWEGHTYHPSPGNWRFPFYTLFLDRYVNGDPTNDNINGTLFEHDLNSNQMRHGGDIAGMIDSLDYLHGMGVKVRVIPIFRTMAIIHDGSKSLTREQGIYIAGSPFINQPWGSDSYSPLDFTLLDRHYGNI